MTRRNALWLGTQIARPNFEVKTISEYLQSEVKKGRCSLPTAPSDMGRVEMNGKVKRC